ncbi:hypothetical protein BDZ89DRAFT_1082126 [Hymenopellis radicata]|nr:hypothetical protein BDZ89DRAFT_1082126 [Hymenopellis radicata]
MDASGPAPAEFTWTSPTFDFSAKPKLTETLSLQPDSESPHNFARKSLWLVASNFLLYTTLYMRAETQSTLPQSAPILDFAWYPGASSSTPATYCFVASVRECPIKLLDAADGRLRASYSIVDHRERQVAPHSLAFSPGGDKLFCGFDSAFEMFNVGSPGEQGVRVLTSPAKKSRDGIKGIISSLTHAPASNSIAIGSLTPSPWNIALYDLDTEPVTPAMYLGLGETASAGVTQLTFNPTSPHLLYASFRRRDGVYAWDLRYLGEGPLCITRLGTLLRYFSLDVTGRWMSVGHQDGNIHTWDLTTASDEEHSSASYSIPNVAYHPFEAKVLSCSGGRHFSDSTDSESSDEEDGVQRRRVLQPIARDVSLKIWDLSGRQS